MRKYFILIILGYLIIFTIFQGETMSQKKLPAQIQNYRESHEHVIINEYFNLLSIPNVSRDTTNIRKNTEFIKQMMEKRGIDARIIETKGKYVIEIQNFKNF